LGQPATDDNSDRPGTEHHVAHLVDGPARTDTSQPGALLVGPLAQAPRRKRQRPWHRRASASGDQVDRNRRGTVASEYSYRAQSDLEHDDSCREDRWTHRRRGLGQRRYCHHFAYGRAAAWPGLSPAGVFWGCPCRVH